MAAKPSSDPTQPETLSSSTALRIPTKAGPVFALDAQGVLVSAGINGSIPKICDTKGFYSDFIGSFLKVDRIQRGRITCTVFVKPPISNYYKILHGAGLAAVVELISIACARTVVAEDKELFLGEMSMSYLSGAPTNAEVLVDGSVVKSGRNLTVVALEFKLKETEKLVYVARATFYNLPVSKL